MADGEDIDLVLGEVDEAALGQKLLSHIAVKGFCVLDLGLDEGVQRQIHGEVGGLKDAGLFSQPPAEIAEGLLGTDGSARIAELAADEAADCQGIRRAEWLMMQMGEQLNWHSSDLGFRTAHRTNTVVHESGVPEEGPALDERVAAHWLETFKRHRIMAMVFAGPMEGTLRLQVYDDEDADSHDIRTRPGVMVLCRPDLMSHKHVALGKAVAITSFFVEGGVAQKRQAAGAGVLTPVAEELEAWAMQRVRQLKSENRDEADWDSEVPREWQKAMNLSFLSGHATAVQGLACRLPGSWRPDAWFQSGAAGPDTIGEVPLSRWNHEDFYDPDPQSWRRGKIFTNHGGFCEGLELFENALFGLSKLESQGMDPNQRLLLEVGYEGLRSMGLTKKQLMNGCGSVYAGNQFGEIAFVDVPEECRGCGPTGGAGCIAANRISYILGLKGPSMGVDADSASGLSALYMVAESVQRKGRGKAADFGIGCACATMLSPVWWHAHCGLGWMSRKGRCFTFDVGADGYCRSDGVVAVGVRPGTEEVDGEVVLSDTNKTLGLLLGANLSSSGAAATLATPSFAATTEIIVETCRTAGISRLDVDYVEAHGSGMPLHDVVDLGSLQHGHRPVDTNCALSVSSVKTLCGDTMATGGLTSYMRVLQCARWGVMAASLHLRQANPYMDHVDSPVNLLSEALETPGRTSAGGVMSRGFGGTHVYCVHWGAVDDEKVLLSPGVPEGRRRVAFWPAGGGFLEGAARPDAGYSIVGSFGDWGDPQEMEEESVDVWAATVTLGESGWEQFQIWVDADPRRVLHPGRPAAPMESPVLGPDGAQDSASWLIEGHPPGADAQTEPLAVAGAAEGRPGDQYRVRLRVAGKFRRVDWERDTSSP